MHSHDGITVCGEDIAHTMSIQFYGFDLKRDSFFREDSLNLTL